MTHDMIPVMLLTFFVSFCGVAFLLPNIVRLAVKNNLFDIPDDRHIHIGMIPRLGGAAFLPVMLVALIVAVTMDSSLIDSPHYNTSFVYIKQILVAGIGAVILYLVGLADDLSGVPYRNKFIAQVLAALLVCASGVWISDLHGFFGIHDIPMWAGVPLTMLIVMVTVNSVNMLDGIDGLASGICIIGMTAFAIAFVTNGLYRFALVAVAAIGCLMPFYIYNVFGKIEKNNKIFLGDTGSLFMGYLLAFFAVKATSLAPPSEDYGESYYLIYSYSVLLLPVFDVMRVFLKRLRRGRNPFLPDRTHIHHKFLAVGLSMRQTRFVIFLIASLFIVMNLAFCHLGMNINLIVLTDLIIWCAYHGILTKVIGSRIQRSTVHTTGVLPVVVAAVVVVSSCANVKDIAYFQNRVTDRPEKTDKHGGIVIQPKDMLSIVVSSRNPELAAMFNLPVVSYQAGSESNQLGGYSQRLMCYTVDNDGMIDFPVLGKLKVAALTRWELAEMIKKRLVSDGYLSDAVVTVEFLNFKISVIGEVTSPGTFTIEGDKVTVLQALALARDLTIYGKRDNISVIREQDGHRVIYQVDLTDVDMFGSPAYYLQQNDIVYVEPNEEKARQSTIDDKSLRLTSIAVSSASVLLSLVSILINVMN